MNYKEYASSSKFQKLLKQNIINVNGDEVLFEIEDKDKHTNLLISKNKEVGFFTLKREFNEIDLKTHNGLDDESENSLVKARTQSEYEFRIWCIPNEYLKEILELLESSIVNKIHSLTNKDYYFRALKETFKANIESWLTKIFDYDTLKVLLGQYETKFYLQKLNKELNIYFNNLDFDATYITYYQNAKNRLLDIMEKDPTYKEIEIYNVDDKGIEHYEWKSQYPVFVKKVLEVKELEITLYNIPTFISLEKEILEMYNTISQMREEYYQKLKGENNEN